MNRLIGTTMEGIIMLIAFDPTDADVNGAVDPLLIDTRPNFKS